MARPRNMPRSFKAGQRMGRAVNEMVNLMYQNNTAKNFLLGLAYEIGKEMDKREVIDHYVKRSKKHGRA